MAPARVVLTTPRLELRLPGEGELARLAAVAAAGVHDPGTQPFGTPWGSQPPGLRARSVLQWHWAIRGTWCPLRWTFDFAVFLDGEPIGAQGLSAVGFRSGARWPRGRGSAGRTSGRDSAMRCEPPC
jgi:hypothetical protein